MIYFLVCNRAFVHNSKPTLLQQFNSFELYSDTHINSVSQLRRELKARGEDDMLKELRKSASGAGDVRMTSVRVFEAIIPGGNRVYVKEFLSVGATLGKVEMVTTKRLTRKFNENIEARVAAQEEITVFPTPPFPTLLGYLKTDKRIEDPIFKERWMERFPRISPPREGNLWLIFRWDESTFKSLKSFPKLPQIVEINEYMNKKTRDKKRWKFVRKTMLETLKAVRYFHRNGYCHNSIFAESIWMSTTNQAEVDTLKVKLVDLGTAQAFSDLGKLSRQAAMEDLYNVGLVFIQFVINSFVDDTTGAMKARAKISGRNEMLEVMMNPDSTARTQLGVEEISNVFEDICDSDFATFRDFINSIQEWSLPSEMLEANSGAGWKLIFRLLARGRLTDPQTGGRVKVTPSTLIKESKVLFEDVM